MLSVSTPTFSQDVFAIDRLRLLNGIVSWSSQSSLDQMCERTSVRMPTKSTIVRLEFHTQLEFHS